MELSCSPRISRLVSQDQRSYFWCFIPYNKSFIDQACSVKMAGCWPRSFFACYGDDKHAKKELGQYPAILTLRLVNNQYKLSWFLLYWGGSVVGDENIISKYKFASFQSIYDYFNPFNVTRVWYGSSSRMTLVGTVVNLGENMKLFSLSADVLHKTSNLAISRCCFANDSNGVDKSEKRTCRACKAIVFRSLKGPIHTSPDISESATFSFRSQKYFYPHVVYSNRICPSTRIRNISGFTLVLRGTFFKSPETLRAIFGCHNSLCNSRTERT